MKIFDSTYIATLQAAVTDLCDGSSRLFNANNGEPAAGSPAEQELSLSPQPKSIVTAFTVTHFLIEYSGEHLSAFVKTLNEPIEPLAAFTCVRSMLESCALAVWMVDPDIDHVERLARQFAYRYQGLEQQLKYGRVASLNSAELNAIEKRIDDVESTAIGLGYAKITNSRNKRIGIGRQMPAATQIIGLMLNEEKMYRLLSAVAHGHMWAQIQLGFQPAATTEDQSKIAGIDVHAMEKTVHVKFMAYLGLVATKAIARPMWHFWRYIRRTRDSHLLRTT